MRLAQTAKLRTTEAKMNFEVTPGRYGTQPTNASPMRTAARGKQMRDLNGNAISMVRPFVDSG